MDSCSTKPRDYRKPFDEYRQTARSVTSRLSSEIDATGSISWERVMQAADRDEIVYKLTLKYLRQKGYDIGSYRQPFVSKK